MSEDRSVHTDDVLTFENILTPPEFFDVTLELCSQRAVVPATVKTSVEFSRLEDEAFPFAERDDFFHTVGVSLVFVGHGEEV